jgi:uncharacterized protein
MIKRTIKATLTHLAKKLPAIALTGPRQSGKTTLAKAAFPDKPYVTLENQNTLSFAQSDPQGFIETYPKGAIFDEVQRAPGLFSALQVKIDEINKPGLYILTGSQQFLLNQHISQSLAGRIGLLHLLPFDLNELAHIKNGKPTRLEEIIFKGMYPRIYQSHLRPMDWYPSYIRTYIERDVRLIKNIENLSLFQKFLKMCAARTGQILNMSSLASDCGITHVTAEAWMTVLEASYIVFRLKPYHQNFNKRLVKAPKLYFYDTGLLCSLLDIQNEKDLLIHPMRGAFFETLVVSDLLKQRFHQGLPSNLYYWRDKAGHEIDCILEQGVKRAIVEIKSGQTISGDWFRSLEKWREFPQSSVSDAYLIYGGKENQHRAKVNILSWTSIKNINRSNG